MQGWERSNRSSDVEQALRGTEENWQSSSRGRVLSTTQHLNDSTLRKSSLRLHHSCLSHRREQRADSLGHRHYRTGWVLLDRAALGEGLHGPRDCPPDEQFASIAHRAFAARSEDLRQNFVSALRGFVGHDDVRRIFREVQPGEVYHLAGQSHVGLSFDIPESHLRRSRHGDASIASRSRATRITRCDFIMRRPRKFLGTQPNRLKPRTPRCDRPAGTGAPKRSRLNCAGFTGNPMDCLFVTAFFTIMSSPRRGENFVTRKIARAVARIRRGLDSELVREFGK